MLGEVDGLVLGLALGAAVGACVGESLGAALGESELLHAAVASTTKSSNASLTIASSHTPWLRTPSSHAITTSAAHSSGTPLSLSLSYPYAAVPP